MTDLVSITAPIFLLIALGFFAVRLRFVDAELIRGLGAFVLNFARAAWAPSRRSTKRKSTQSKANSTSEAPP